jgi:calcineurin-like phosphoesterase family protein
MAIFFTSDTHFGHETIIRLCKRPFGSVEEMNETLVARWNETVAPGDTVYHLGDFCYRNAHAVSEYRRQLNGTIRLILGNHDTLSAEDSAQFETISHIDQIKPNGHELFLCHYPMREWNRCWRGAWHLFGHVHGGLNHAPHGYSMDVGVDGHDFRPWSLEEIASVMDTRENPFTGRRS